MVICAEKGTVYECLFPASKQLRWNYIFPHFLSGQMSARSLGHRVQADRVGICVDDRHCISIPSFLVGLLGEVMCSAKIEKLRLYDFRFYGMVPIINELDFCFSHLSCQTLT